MDQDLLDLLLATREAMEGTYSCLVDIANGNRDMSELEPALARLRFGVMNASLISNLRRNIKVETMKRGGGGRLTNPKRPLPAAREPRP